MTKTCVFVYFLIYPDLCRALEAEANCEAWQRVCDRYILIYYIPGAPVQPDRHRDDILIYDEESAAQFIERIRREAAEDE